MLLASLRFALPEKTMSDEIDKFLPRFAYIPTILEWLGRQDSNLRMRGSKPRALTRLGDVPVVSKSTAVQSLM